MLLVNKHQAPLKIKMEKRIHPAGFLDAEIIAFIVSMHSTMGFSQFFKHIGKAGGQGINVFYGQIFICGTVKKQI